MRQCRPTLGVSTHAPLAGSDAGAPSSAALSFGFNPRSPCGERLPPIDRVREAIEFQPTLPLRGATRTRGLGCSCTGCFNPRSPCGERRVEGACDSLLQPVSTHAPLAGSDVLPARRLHHHIRVSTHAPLAGSDGDWWRVRRVGRGFNPRSPCGERLATPPMRPRSSRFNPRSPCGERREVR